MNGAIDHALRIPGWTSRIELEWLHASAAGLGLAVELGAWMGRSTVALSSARGVLSVDNWEGSPEHAGMVPPDLFDRWLENSGRYASVLPGFRCDLSDALRVGELLASYGGRAGMVFVDASHDRASVARDIGIARRLLVRGGLLCGHDMCDAWPGVMAAVDECVPGWGRVPDTTIWRSVV
jgi:hypothetical protein